MDEALRFVSASADNIDGNSNKGRENKVHHQRHITICLKEIKKTKRKAIKNHENSFA